MFAPTLRCGVLAALGMGLLTSAVTAAEKGKVAMETVEYKGWKRNLRLTNGDIELIATLDVGPRIISYRLNDGTNVFKEYEDQLGQSGEPEWQIRGGHRLWTAPEDTSRTYAPDNAPARFEPAGDDGVRLQWPADAQHGIAKEILLRLDPEGTRVHLTHRITNTGTQPTELAPWALSVMRPGGVEILPMPPSKPHPGSPKNAKSAADFAADRHFVFWPYTDLTDPRWHFGKRFITLRQDAEKGPTKLGTDLRLGWAAYLNDGTLFVKRFGYQEGASYPDGGCSYETFTNQDMLEMESLGPLVRLAPGAAVEHREDWELIGGLGGIRDEGDIETKIEPRIRPQR